MDKNQESSTDLHSSSSVKCLIEKFERLCKTIHEGSPVQLKESKSNVLVSLSGHVTETVAKFEENLYVHGNKKMLR